MHFHVWRYFAVQVYKREISTSNVIHPNFNTESFVKVTNQGTIAFIIKIKSTPVCSIRNSSSCSDL